MADVESRAIIFTMVNEAMTASDLSYALKIPLSSVYKKLSDLQELTLVHVEKNILAEDGKKHRFYRSRIKKAEIIIKKPEPTLTMQPNTDSSRLGNYLIKTVLGFCIFNLSCNSPSHTDGFAIQKAIIW